MSTIQHSDTIASTISNPHHQHGHHAHKRDSYNTDDNDPVSAGAGVGISKIIDEATQFAGVFIDEPSDISDLSLNDVEAASPPPQDSNALGVSGGKFGGSVVDLVDRDIAAADDARYTSARLNQLASSSWNDDETESSNGDADTPDDLSEHDLSHSDDALERISRDDSTAPSSAPPELTAEEKISLLEEEFGKLTGKDEEERMIAEVDGGFAEEIAILVSRPYLYIPGESSLTFIHSFI